MNDFLFLGLGFWHTKIVLTAVKMILVLIIIAPHAAEANTLLSSAENEFVWPWDTFLKSLAQELTGPLPTTLGIMGVVGASIALFAGYGGDATKKFIVLILAVSIALSAPTLVDWLAKDVAKMATGVMIGGN